VKYILIDHSGNLTEGYDDNWEDVLREVGPEGSNRIQLTPNLTAWVNDCGLILPDRYRRNPVAGAMLMAFGAQEMPYAGDIVFTGWDARATLADRAEVVGLGDAQAAMLKLLHGWVARVLVGDDRLRMHGPGREAVEQISGWGNLVLNGPVPGWAVHTA
jgi:hypothetical protein